MRILFAGGGTLGPVIPLLAVATELQADGHTVTFVGTATGPERRLVKAAGIGWHHIIAPKLPRYITWMHVLFPFQAIAGLWQAWRLLRELKPDAVSSAGGYVAVPISLMAWVYRIPVCLHQQDVTVSLTNRLLAPLARLITVTFEQSKQDFRVSPRRRVVWTGNPVRDLTPTTNQLQLDPAYPTVMIFGGGTGAAAINQLVSPALCNTVNVIHIAGSGRDGAASVFSHPRYHRFELLGEAMKEAYAKADLVVARAGIGTISELAALGKPAIIIPMPHSHQEANAKLLLDQQAAFVVDQSYLTAEALNAHINNLLDDPIKCQQLSEQIAQLQPAQATPTIVAAIITLV